MALSLNFRIYNKDEDCTNFVHLSHFWFNFMVPDTSSYLTYGIRYVIYGLHIATSNLSLLYFCYSLNRLTYKQSIAYTPLSSVMFIRHSSHWGDTVNEQDCYCNNASCLLVLTICLLLFQALNVRAKWVATGSLRIAFPTKAKWPPLWTIYVSHVWTECKVLWPAHNRRGEYAMRRQASEGHS